MFIKSFVYGAMFYNMILYAQIMYNDFILRCNILLLFLFRDNLGYRTIL